MGTVSDGLPHYRTGDPGLDAQILELLAAAGLDHDQRLLFEMVTSVLRMGREGVGRGELKIASSTLKEMRYAFEVFAPYRSVLKAAVFGSARTTPEKPAYRAAQAISTALVEHDWMVISGGGPGIMTAAIEGAGPDDSFGVSIILPFEPSSARPLISDGKSVNFRYFFNRKLTFMKESAGYVLFPGGFGTLDEAFELLTLLQTGRETPAPVVLFEPRGDAYWRSFRHFLEVELLDAGLIAPDDLDIFTITSDVDEAVAVLTSFYRRYHSLRYVGGRLVLRLRHDIGDDLLGALNAEFADIVAKGTIERCGPSRAEIDDDDAVALPRLRLHFVNDHFARLHHLVQALNRD